MSAILLPSCGLRIPAVDSSFKSVIYGREIADGTSLCPFNGSLLQLSTIRCEGSRRAHPRRNTSSDKTAKEDNSKDFPVSDAKSSRASSKREIIDLFRRIQSSISKEPTVSKRVISRNTKEKQIFVSVLGALRQNPRSKQVLRGLGGKENKAVFRRRDTSEDETKEFAPLSGDLRPSRPVSNFVKRSPIPAPTQKNDTGNEALQQASNAIVEEVSGVQKLDGMKLPELKEIARAKGVKGYSKLKKGELLELLKGVLQSS